MHVDVTRRLFSFHDALTQELPPIDWDVQPLIAHGNRVVVYGEFGCGKSWALVDLAIHLSLGIDWLGAFKISRPHKVLYIDEEMPEWTLRNRLRRVASGRGLSEQDIKEVPLWFESFVGFKLSCAAGVENFFRDLADNGIDPDIIIVETLRRVIGGTENDAQDVGRMWEAVVPLVRHNKTFILAHHMRKPSPVASGSARHKASGSTDILAGADAAFAVSRITQDSMSIECVKSRVVEEPPPFTIGLFDVPGSTDRAVELQHLGTKEDTERSPRLLDGAVDCIRSWVQVGRHYQRSELMLLLKDFTASTANRAFHECERRGVLLKAGRGVWVAPDCVPEVTHSA